MDVERRLEHDLHRQRMAEAAMPVGAVVSFSLAAVTVPFQGLLARGIVLALLVVTVASVGGLTGRGGALMTACMAAFAFDFFHVAPVRILHLPTLAGLSLVLGCVALLAGAGVRRARETPDDHR